MFGRHFEAAVKALPAENGVPVDLQELFKRLSMDIITDMLFGSSTNTLTQTESDGRGLMTFSHACEYSQKVVWRKIALGWIGTLWPDREDRRSRRLLHQTADQWVQEILQQGTPVEKQQDRKHCIFLENLAQRTQDPKVLRDQLLSALLGGRDTTSSLLSQLFHTLARRPDIWQRLREEAKSLGPGPMTQASMKNAGFAHQCLQESLRLHPVVPINQRWANADTILPRGGGPDQTSPLIIPRGTNAYTNIYAMHRRQDIWGDDADEFKPERWGNNPRQKGGWAYVPFGGGPMVCIGPSAIMRAEDFALAEAAYILIRMLQRFEKVEPADEEPWRENLSITVASGCRVRLHRGV